MSPNISKQWNIGSTHIFTQRGWPFFRAAPKWGNPAKLSLPQTFRTGQTHLPFALYSRSTTSWGKPSNLWTSWPSLRLRVLSWTWIKCMESATHRNTFMSPLTFVMSTATRKFCSDIQLPNSWATLSGDFHPILRQQPEPHIHGWLHHFCP